MSDEKPSEDLQIEYIERRDCPTLPCSGFVLASPPRNGGMYQLMLYADVSKLHPQTLKRVEGETPGDRKLTAGDSTLATYYREVQAKVLIPRDTLLALARIIAKTFPDTQAPLASTPEAESE